MNIDFTVKEYFEQLQLMEKQYAQEEGLYPWIYMLLQMVESKKQELLGESYEGVSIRDVHNAVSGYKAIVDTLAKEIKMYMQKSAFPDFIIFDRNISENNKCSCFGCVEIKTLGNYYLTINKECYKVEIPTEYNYDMKFEIIENEIRKRYCVEIDKQQYQELLVFLKNDNIMIKVIDNTDNTVNVEFSLSTNEKYIVKKAELKSPGRKFPKNTQVRKIPRWSEPFGKNVSEMMSHIKSYNKVLYTNGLQFCIITLLKENNDDIFKVTEIANLKDVYETYKKEGSIEAVSNEAKVEWEKLKTGLLCIDWYSNPIVIPDTNTQE